MAVNYFDYRPEAGSSTYVQRFQDLITALETDINALIVLSDANESYINSIPSTGFSLNDNVPLQIGTGSDTELYHDGGNSYIDHTGTGNLYIRGGVTLTTVLGITDTVITSSKGITLSSGVFTGDLTGDLTGNTAGTHTGPVVGNADTASNSALLDSLDSTEFVRKSVDSTINADLTFNNNKIINLGASSDMQMYHSGANGYIYNNTGTFTLTSAGGITMTGDTIVNGIFTADGVILGDSEAIYFGASSDAYIYHDATNTRIRNNTGNLYITHGTSNRIISYAAGSVGLYYGGALCAITNSYGGLDLTGDLNINGERIFHTAGARVYLNSVGITWRTTAPPGWSASYISSGRYRITHNMGTANYTAIAEIDGTYATSAFARCSNFSTNTFDVYLGSSTWSAINGKDVHIILTKCIN